MRSDWRYVSWTLAYTMLCWCRHSMLAHTLCSTEKYLQTLLCTCIWWHICNMCRWFIQCHSCKLYYIVIYTWPFCYTCKQCIMSDILYDWVRQYMSCHCWPELTFYFMYSLLSGQMLSACKNSELSYIVLNSLESLARLEKGPDRQYIPFYTCKWFYLIWCTPL